MSIDREIARRAQLLPIQEIAARAGIPSEALELYGRYKAKIRFDFIRSLKARPDARLVLMVGMSPTPAGEGKTTTAIGLGDALNAIGQRTVICLREPSLGPCFGQKGGATGGGYAQVAPPDDINLHFTGDFHAIAAANNVFAAMIDNHLHWDNALGLDPRRISWRRALDVNDRALRHMAIGLGGANGGVPREEGFNITAASEVMAVFCLARDLADLQERLGRMLAGQRRDGSFVTARELRAEGAMAALLRDAFMPNLVQTLGGSPALVHGGPFGNIAHGCNSLIATQLGLKLADVVVTEAGFGADLGGEKFLNIKARMGNIQPDCAVVVATIRALKMQGGVAKAALDKEDVEAVTRGLPNLERHVENMQKFGLPVLVAINAFPSDTAAEMGAVVERLADRGIEVVRCTHWADGAKGAEALARAVMRTMETRPSRFRPLYADSLPLAEKIRTIAREIYRAGEVFIPSVVRRRLEMFEEAGYGAFPVCIAKTQYSFTADPAVLGAPEGHILPVRDVYLSAGAGFVVAICGEILTMPALPRHPAAEAIGLDEEGNIVGL
ncbi:MAG: formate--tetrahydrofolate ligase [Acidobacteriia bacterium]|nr:formate--tetrahydrofolate ligase [Methyloceanibacter sp.]MBX5473322.1 formate--tetrahydrofolate ligase [Acetobacteraceae bacterium]MCL6493045.1 formate--tetrahydrofolate ligase [Terriglobia bacterium]